MSTSGSGVCVRSRSFDISTGVTFWSKQVTYIALTKSEAGLGFSLLDYQHSTFNDLSTTVIVIRALVANGVAQRDGRLQPGQRLVSINGQLLDAAANEERERNNKHTNNNNNSGVNNASKSTHSLYGGCGCGCSFNLLEFTVKCLKQTADSFLSNVVPIRSSFYEKANANGEQIKW